MHNKHYIIIKENSKDEVVRIVEDELNRFGDENNWYNIEEVINLNKITSEEREEVEKCLTYLNNEITSSRNNVLERISNNQDKLDSGNRFLYYDLSCLYKQLYELSGVKHTYSISNILNGHFEEYYSCQYDEYGITHLYTDCYDEEENQDVFFVRIDMHS